MSSGQWSERTCVIGVASRKQLLERSCIKSVTDGRQLMRLFMSSRSRSSSRRLRGYIPSASCRTRLSVCHLLTQVVLQLLYCSLPTAHCPLLNGQQVVDKMVATVNAGILPECRQICLITYSDLLWQLALQPNSPLAISYFRRSQSRVAFAHRPAADSSGGGEAAFHRADFRRGQTARDEFVKRFLRRRNFSSGCSASG